MDKLLDLGDPVRDALEYGESAPADFSSWPAHECLRRLRLRFHLNRKQLAAKAGVSASLIGRAEKGADVRLSTLRKLYAALGCQLFLLPVGWGALYELDWLSAHLDNDWIDWKRKNAHILEPLKLRVHSFHPSETGDMNGNAIAPPASTSENNS